MLGSDARGTVIGVPAAVVVKDAYGVVASLTVDAVGASAAVTATVRDGVDADARTVFAVTVPAGQVQHFVFPRGLVCAQGIYVEVAGGAGQVSLTFL